MKIVISCKIEGCEKPKQSRGWCRMHYTRWRRHGDPEVVLPRVNWTGKKHSEEAKKKMAAAKIGKPGPWAGKKRPSPSLQTRSKMGLAHLGFKHTAETRKRMSESQRLGPRWNGGIYPLNQSIRRSAEYGLWRKAVFQRDNYICVLGGVVHRGRKLNADHIKPFAYFPELRFDITNGRTLCEPCHRQTETWGRKQ